MGLTLEQLQIMGAQPVSAPTPTIGLTESQLQGMGAQPVTPTTQSSSNLVTPQSLLDQNRSPYTEGWIGKIIKNAFQSGVGQIKEGQQQTANSANPITQLEGAAKIGAGAINAAASPLAPIFAPVGAAVNAVADKVSNIPQVQKFAMSKAGQATARVAEDVGNVATIAQAVLPVAAKGLKPEVSPETQAHLDYIQSTADVTNNALKEPPTEIPELQNPETLVKSPSQVVLYRGESEAGGIGNGYATLDKSFADGMGGGPDRVTVAGSLPEGSKILDLTNPTTFRTHPDALLAQNEIDNALTQKGSTPDSVLSSYYNSYWKNGYDAVIDTGQRGEQQVVLNPKNYGIFDTTNVPPEAISSIQNNITRGLSDKGVSPETIKQIQDLNPTDYKTPQEFSDAASQIVKNAPEVISETISQTPQENSPEVQDVIDKRTSALQQIEDNNGPIRKVVTNATNRGIDVKGLVANTDLLQGSVDENGNISTLGKGGAVDEFNQFMNKYEGAVSDALNREGKSIPLSDVEDALRAKINDSGIAGGSKTRLNNILNQEIEGLKLDTDENGNISLSKLQDAKISTTNGIDYTRPESKISAKMVADTYKTLIEDNSDLEIKQLNAELSKYYTIGDYLEALNGKKVAGGKMGKYFAQVVGGMAGSHFGPFGTILGAEIASKIKGMFMSSTFGSEIGQNLEASQPLQNTIMQNTLPRIGLPAPQVGVPKVSNNIPIQLGGESTIEVAPKVINRNN